ncbi:major histocompatibility complex class I-related gene protein-like isoform X1 [Paramormyrops kingsleyae]|uniref:major histocompatibility complex class I-related gene protein-like isoform X1 n=2 Tax=Paramormyrops kingsleyae TaxID=1676925 RepID=UPI003B977EE4
MRKIALSTLLLFRIHSIFSLTYSLRYVFTGTSGIPDFPEFVGVGLVDGEPIDYYDSRIGRMTPRQDWMTKAVDADYWDRETQHLRGGEQVFKTNIEVAKQRFNQTGGIHTAQMMYGCELDGDGTIRGYNLQGYDGEDFISLDLNTLTWTAANQKAVITKLKWDPKYQHIQGWKNYLQITCIEWLKKYLDHGRDTLQKKVPPVVSLLHRDDSSPVICHATGFSPSGVVMFWQKDGLELHDDVTVGETVPNGDGTFQKRISLRVSPEDLREHEYTCTVQHISDDRDVVKAVMEKQILSNSNSGSPLTLIGVYVSVSVLVVTVGIGAFLVWRKRSNSGFVPAKSKIYIQKLSTY